MTSKDFKDWRDRLGLTQHNAADLLGLSRATIARYEDGEDIPQPVRYACSFLEQCHILAVEDLRQRIADGSLKQAHYPIQGAAKSAFDSAVRRRYWADYRFDASEVSNLIAGLGRQ